MGREIRRVPPNWQHPTYRELGTSAEDRDAPRWGDGIDNPHPVRDQNFEDAYRAWCERDAAWNRGEEEGQLRSPEVTKNYSTLHQWDGGPPNPLYYRHGKWVFAEEQAAHFQMYETVTEGTPVSPVFETLGELEEWMVKEQGHSREAAHRFVESGWAPSGVVVPGRGVLEGIEGLRLLG